jgi:hypothetical protein
MPHDGAYEYLFDVCKHRTKIRHRCPEHKRFSKSCAEGFVGGCWIELKGCECTESDRLIADLKEELTKHIRVAARAFDLLDLFDNRGLRVLTSSLHIPQALDALRDAVKDVAQ